MAETVGSADFIVRVRDMVTGPMKSIGANIASGLKGAGIVAAGNLLASGIQRAAAASKDFLMQGIATNAQFDNLNNTFTVMLGSQQRAAALMKDLTTFAAKTPFEMGSLAQASAALLATRQVGEQQVIPMLKKLGDAAAGSTDGFASMPRVVRAISQMLSKGKLQAEEMMQLAEAGIPAWGALADKMGMSTAEVQQLAQKGKLGVREILMLVDGLGDKYAGLAEKQSKTFSGLSSTISDNINLALAKITRPIYDRMTKLMAQLVKVMESDAFLGAIDSIANGISNAIAMFDRLIESTGAWVQQFSDTASILTANFAKTWEFMKAGFDVVILWIGDQIIYTFTERLPTAIAGMIEAFMAGGTELVIHWRTIFEALENYIRGVFDDLFAWMANKYRAMADGIAAALRGDRDGVGIAVARAAGADIAGAAAMKGRGEQFAQAIAPAGAAVMGRMREAMAEAMALMPKFAPSDALKAAQDRAGKIWDEMRRERNNKRFGQMVEGLGLKEMPGMLGKGIADLVAGGGKGLFGGIDKFIEFFHKKPADDKKKNLKSEFVGISDMNKRIQSMLGGEDKDKKAQLKAAQQGAKAAEKGAAVGEKVFEAVNGVKDAIGKVMLGFGK